MSEIIQSPNVFSEPTTNSSISLPEYPQAVGHAFAISKASLYIVESDTADEPVSKATDIPSGYMTVDDLISTLGAEGFDVDLNEANKRISKKLYENEQHTLSALRLNKGWTQAELARRVGTSQSRIARIENGHDDPRLSTVVKIARALGLDLNTMELALQKNVDSASGNPR